MMYQKQLGLPYKGTSEYQEGGFNHDDLDKYIKNSEHKKIYVSSYDFDLPCVAEFKHRSIKSATSNKEVIEKLFCNKEHIDRTRLF